MGHSPRNLCTLARLPRFYSYQPVGLGDRQGWPGFCGNKAAIGGGTAALLAGGRDAGGGRAARLVLTAAGADVGVNLGPIQAVATGPTAPVVPADAQPTASRPNRPLGCRNCDPDRSKALAASLTSPRHYACGSGVRADTVGDTRLSSPPSTATGIRERRGRQEPIDATDVPRCIFSATLG